VTIDDRTSGDGQAAPGRERHLQEAQRLAGVGSWEWSASTGAEVWSDEMYRLFGLVPESARAGRPAFLATVHPDDRVRVQEVLDAALRDRRPFDVFHRIVRPDGSMPTIRSRGEALVENGQTIGVLGTVQDFTNVREQEEALKESESRFRQMAETVRGVFWMSDPINRRLLYISPGYETLWGRSVEAFHAQRGSFLEGVHPDDRERLLDAYRRQCAGQETDDTHRAVRPDGSIRWVRNRGYPIRDHEGRVYRITGEAEDITESRLLEEQLRQSQKMEAVGQLAGGIAHDFNNILTAILVYGERVQGRLQHDHRARRDIEEIRKAANRAAALTHQLLAFSRKQVLKPKVLDLNGTVRDTERMLSRLIGEDIRIETALSPTPVYVKADPGQLEQVILNLAVNARDAMPKGGRLLVETRDVVWDDAGAREQAVPAGRYVMLAVTDTGCGMDADTQSRVFEPFFTTKEQGKGTGLGLSMVYGSVQQGGGYVRLESAPDQGSTFRIYLPRVDAEHEQAAGETSAVLRRGSETILLVEDDQALRQVVYEVLEDNGYHVMTARDGHEALAICRRGTELIDLLVTDIVMPGANGVTVAKAFREHNPRLKVICMSGYTEHASLKEEILDTASVFVQKPFTTDAFLATVRDVLDRSEAPVRPFGTLPGPLAE
jgi:two-component system, cell cycle sensor histidine kinase and response regulator CckA